MWELGDVLYVIEMIFGALLELVEQVLEVEFFLALIVAIAESGETQYKYQVFEIGGPTHN